MQAYIQGRNVNLTFRPPNRGPVRALQGFDIDIREGEFLSIVGPSGCGKSTFLNVLLGLIKPDSGDLRCAASRSPVRAPTAPWCSRSSACCRGARCEHNVELGLELKGMAADARREISQRADRHGRAHRLRGPLSRTSCPAA